MSFREAPLLLETSLLTHTCFVAVFPLAAWVTFSSEDLLTLPLAVCVGVVFFTVVFDRVREADA